MEKDNVKIKKIDKYVYVDEIIPTEKDILEFIYDFEFDELENK